MHPTSHRAKSALDMRCAVGVSKGIVPLRLIEFRRLRDVSIRACAVALVPPNPVKTPGTERDSQPGSILAKAPVTETQIRWHRLLRPSRQTGRNPVRSPFSQSPGCRRRDLRTNSLTSTRRSFRARRLTATHRRGASACISVRWSSAEPSIPGTTTIGVLRSPSF